MKKLMSIVIAMLFALSLSGLAFAQASQDVKPAGDTVKSDEKAPAKAKKAKKAPKAKKAKKTEKTEEMAPAPDKK